MNKEKLNDIICESSSDYEILNNAYDYIENLEQQCKKQQEAIEKIAYKIENYTTLNAPRIRKELLNTLNEVLE